jgi:hypothetical protein
MNGWRLVDEKPRPRGDENANDDPKDTDESPNPPAPPGTLPELDYTDPRNNHFYSMDRPGVELVNIERAYRGTAWEFLRVNFQEKRPTGEGIIGSRSSNKYEWHASHHWRYNNNRWERTTGDITESAGQNDIDRRYQDPTNPPS